MKKFSKSKIFYLLLSLFFALLLYFNANNTINETGTTQEFSENSDEYTTLVSRLPVKLEYDKDKYFVSTNINTIDVTLKSRNKVVLDAESNAQTRSFYAAVDLKQYKTGTYTVPIKIKGLNHSVKSHLSQSSMQVTIENKASKVMPISTNIDKDWVRKGLEISNIKIQPKKVAVSASQEDIKTIHRVVAKLEPQTDISKSFTTKVNLVAYNQKGEEMVATFDTPSVKVSVDVDAPKKEVGLNLIQKGKQPKSVSSYQLLCDTQKINIQGTKTELSNVHSLDIPIDITGIEKTTTRQVNLNLPKDIKSKTTSITVTIVPQLSHS